MSADSQWQIRAALFTRLRENAALTALLKNGAESISDTAAGAAEMPYLVLGETRAEALDTQTGNGMKLVVALESYSRYRGMREIKQIMQAVYAALHNAQDFDLPGHYVVLCRFLSSRAFTESDGKTRRGIQYFEIITDEKP
ncbi:MAG: DUF3168 domain-containing protein [Micavibrio sp.]|nr:MAG: DUF3168 domain-containing protein [Micavibrio sp.]